MIVAATKDPFTGLFVGLLMTALIQSSSTTTSILVAVVASGFVDLQQAVFVIMGANFGTTFTSTALALSFVDKNKAFRRAVAAGTYHDFFNLLTILILFPIEYRYGLLSHVSENLAQQFATGDFKLSANQHFHLWPGFGFLIDKINNLVPYPAVVAGLSFALIFASILVFRKIISRWLVKDSNGWLRRTFFRGVWRSFLFGLLATAAIRSSTVTTSLVVPMRAQRLVRFRAGASFVRGANIGTTITAFIAALSGGSTGAISLAIAHFLFNVSGVITFSLIPGIKEIPVLMARGLGRYSATRHWVLFAYVIVTFFLAPFALILLLGN